MSLTHGFHPYHLVNESPWPLTGSISAMMLTTSLVKWFHEASMSLLLMGLLSTVLTMIQWWRDVTREATYQGLHTSVVSKGLRWGMILFIVSEVLFFFSFFWAFFQSSLSPTVEIGTSWPLMGIQPFNPFQIPLLNTTILISSGATVTWAHHSITESKHSEAMQSLLLTILLGFYFTGLQALDYFEATFTVADSVYGSTFFVATGFHGLHVIIGTAFLSVCLYRLYMCHFSSSHHFGFEATYWWPLILSLLKVQFSSPVWCSIHSTAFSIISLPYNLSGTLYKLMPLWFEHSPLFPLASYMAALDMHSAGPQVNWKS